MGVWSPVGRHLIRGGFPPTTGTAFFGQATNFSSSPPMRLWNFRTRKSSRNPTDGNKVVLGTGAGVQAESPNTTITCAFMAVEQNTVLHCCIFLSVAFHVLPPSVVLRSWVR